MNLPFRYSSPQEEESRCEDCGRIECECDEIETNEEDAKSVSEEM